MADLKESGITKLAGPITIGMQTTDGIQTLYTVPVGKSCIVTYVIACIPTASLADGVDYDLGDGVAADTWLQTVNLTTMTATTDYMVIESNNIKHTVFNAGDVFAIKPIIGSTADADASIYVFGFLF